MITMEKRQGIAYVTMDRQRSMNSLDDEALEALLAIWTEVRDDDRLRVAVITGAGTQAFCTGGDLKSLMPAVASGAVPLDSRRLQALLKGFPLYKPVVAAVNGACLAGGMELLQATDIRIAVDEAIFGLPEPRWGLFPAAGSTVRLPRQVPYCRAMELLLSGEPISAADALALGLVNRVVPRAHLMSTAVQWAERLARNSAVAVQRIKQAVLQGADLPTPEAFALETALARQVLAHPDAQEGLQAFSQKRAPQYLAEGDHG